jgi:hypothetical protein
VGSDSIGIEGFGRFCGAVGAAIVSPGSGSGQDPASLPSRMRIAATTTTAANTTMAAPAKRYVRRLEFPLLAG